MHSRRPLPATIALLVATAAAAATAWAEPVTDPGRAGGPLSSRVAVSLADLRMGADYYKKKCLVCHGTEGEGDGPGATALDPKPKSFADPKWQAGATDDHIKIVTVEGGPKAGMSAGMPAHPDLKQQPDAVEQLVALIRSFAKQNGSPSH